VLVQKRAEIGQLEGLPKGGDEGKSLHPLVPGPAGHQRNPELVGVATTPESRPEVLPGVGRGDAVEQDEAGRQSLEEGDGLLGIPGNPGLVSEELDRVLEGLEKLEVVVHHQHRRATIRHVA
jgi:hypothetical protein